MAQGLVHRRGTAFLGGGNYRNPSERSFGFVVSLETFNLPTLPERLDGHLQEALIWHLRDPAEVILVTAQRSLVPGHGYDTGLLHDSLLFRLMDHLLATGVWYELLSDQAAYWRWVEFGHWMVNGEFWPGYHYLENAIRAHQRTIRKAVREAWADTAIQLAAEAKVPGITGQLLGR